MSPIFFAHPAAFRRWLHKHHPSARELWVGFYKKHTGKRSITWPESVDEALCVGWIDGIRKTIDEEGYMVRFTPRRRGSIWSAVNIRRAVVLTNEKRMQPAGLAAFAARTERPMDSRWLAFGLQKPGALVTPAKPTGLTLTLMGSDSLQVTCDAMPLATRNRWRMRVVGPGTVFNRVASRVAPLAVIHPVPAGQMVEIIVQAVNGNLQSVASDPVAIAIPAVEAAAAEAKSAPAPVVEELAPLVVTQPNGNKKTKANGSNGNGNGSHSVSRLS